MMTLPELADVVRIADAKERAAQIAYGVCADATREAKQDLEDARKATRAARLAQYTNFDRLYHSPPKGSSAMTETAATYNPDADTAAATKNLWEAQECANRAYENAYAGYVQLSTTQAALDKAEQAVIEARTAATAAATEYTQLAVSLEKARAQLFKARFNADRGNER